ncbi:ankyrin repeat domain-containing protein, partial [Burkholderia pseudomallei]|nr:ankyrin repeat domain-containing protein [Burkholderia pseudomallei]
MKSIKHLSKQRMMGARLRALALALALALAGGLGALAAAP